MCDSTICFSFIKSGLDQLQTILGGATIGKENRIETVNLELASNARTQYSNSKTRQKQNNKMRVQQSSLQWKKNISTITHISKHEYNSKGYVGLGPAFQPKSVVVPSTLLQTSPARLSDFCRISETTSWVVDIYSLVVVALKIDNGVCI